MENLVPERCDFRVGDMIYGSGNTNYRIERKLGEGTFGIVYKVLDNQGRTGALKLLKLWAVPSNVYKGLRDRFVMEFETGKINSSHLAHSYAYGDVKHNPFFVMEFCPNGDLRSYARSNDVDFVSVGYDVLCGLRDLHHEGKVHRDLKPENVLLREDYSAVLTDFGISGDQNKRMTERGIAGKPKQLFGTFPYMPPEQVNPPRGSAATVLPTTDLFSFGVMMYEMLVGKLPFGLLEKDEQLNNYLDNGKNGIWDRESLKRVDRSGVWTSVISRCLEPDYRKRVSSASELMNTLPIVHRPTTPSIDPTVNRSFMTVREGLLLRVMQGDDYGKLFKLNELINSGRRIVTMGRTDYSIQNDICIHDNEYLVSRCHCTFEYDEMNGQWIIRDGQWQKSSAAWKSSMNGTYLNSSEVGRYGMVLNPGDIITIGDVKLRVEGY